VKPSEVTDREKGQDPYPVVICPKKRQDGTTEYVAIYADGFEVRYIPGVSWVIKNPQDPTDATKTLYGAKIIYDYAKRTRTVEEPGKQPVTTVWKDAPTPPTHKTTPGRPPIVATPVVPSKPTPKTPTKTPGRTTTVERPPTPGTGDTPPTTTITFIIKAGATVGGPGDDSIVHFDNPPPITPEEFVSRDQTKTAVVGSPWDGGAKEGPNYQPFDSQPPDGQPPDKTYSFGITSITTLFGWNMFVNVGWGWASATIPAEMVFACADMDDYQEYMNEYRRLMKLAKQAEEGGPNDWRKKAASARAIAVAVENKLASRSHPQETAANARRQADELDKIAKELEDRGIPDKPDPKLPKTQRDALEKARTDAIEKIYDEARQQLRQAGQALK
jgi:hypothetical protein